MKLNLPFLQRFFSADTAASPKIERPENLGADQPPQIHTALIRVR